MASRTVGGLYGRMLCKQEYMDVGVILAGTLVVTVVLVPYVIFGTPFGVAFATAAMVTLVYLGSSIVSKLSRYYKLKKHGSTDKQVNPKSTFGGIGRTVSFALVIGVLSFFASYVSPETVEYSDYNFILIILAISAVPVAAIVLAWFDF